MTKPSPTKKTSTQLTSHPPTTKQLEQNTQQQEQTDKQQLHAVLEQQDKQQPYIPSPPKMKNFHVLHPPLQLMKPDQPDQPLSPLVSDVVIEQIFDETPIREKVSQVQKHVVDKLKKVSHAASNNKVKQGDDMGLKKVSHDKAQTDSLEKDLTITTENITSVKRKRGRPRKKVKAVPTPVISSRIGKNSVFYLQAYASSLTKNQLKAFRIQAYQEENLTVAEEIALDLCCRAADGDQKALDKYWQIVQKEAKTPQIPANTGTTGTLLDDILTEVEGVVWGEVVEETPPNA